MLRLIRQGVMIGAACALVSASALAQSPPGALEPSRLYAQRLRWLEHRIVAGRITTTSVYPEGMNVSFGPSTTAGKLREHLHLLILKDKVSMRYELAVEGRQLAVVLDQDGGLSLRRMQDDPPLNIDFAQRPAGPLTLAVDQGGSSRRVQADSFWHLYLAEPELVRRYLVPQLELLRPAWQLGAMGFAIEEALLRQAQRPAAVDTRRWKHLVAELGSGEFSKREGAQRELKRIGQVALPFLEGLDRAQLDPEQAARVTALIAAMRVDYEDTPERIATWLAADERVWLALLARDELAKRRLAAGQLSLLRGAAIDFDPQADPATRQAQLERLQARRGVAAGDGGVPRASEAARSVPPPGFER